ncbi:MAG: methionyl-tRNA formyltransferase [Pirellulaceae bacterium]
MKLIVMGTGPFAVPAIRWFRESDHEIALLVTRPIEDAGRRRKTVPNPVLELVAAWGDTEIIDPQDINAGTVQRTLQELRADLLFVCDYGQLLSREILATTRLGGINLHGSLLPKYRGAAPINWAIFNGEKETGVTVIHMTPRLDGGPMLVQTKLAIGENETAEQLEPRMAELGVAAVTESIEMLASWDGQQSLGTPQDKGQVTKAPRIRKQQGQLDWSRTARELFNQIRAFQPWPGSFTWWQGDAAQPLRIIVHQAVVVQRPAGQLAGFVEAVDEQSITVATGDGLLQLVEIQPAGKRQMPVTEFLRGRKVAVGDRLGASE